MLTDLIEALQIMNKYGDSEYPIQCEHDVMYICGIEVEDISKEDLKELEQLGFFESQENPGQLISTKFGSA
jgi:hypothetical protein